MNARSLFSLFKQAVKFGAVGVLNTALDWMIYFALTHWIGFFTAMPVAAKAISYSVGVLNSFFINRAWTFRSQAGAARALPLFAAANLLGLLINTGTLHLTMNELHLPELVALVLATGASLGWNFTASKWLVFRARPQKKPWQGSQ
ncbi:MAG TPA: GtrA family protein [Anaerolineaceae bacterium]|nr:GtrA family protein [Anaerolineaceae bacterium]HPN53055.1 GtrA family protein [Anaerolineaceae bacterium]